MHDFYSMFTKWRWFNIETIETLSCTEEKRYAEHWLDLLHEAMWNRCEKGLKMREMWTEK